MNTEHLAYILEAYKCGSVNKAARNCYISQSNLSGIIKNIEREIGYALFRRTSAGVIATPEGQVFMTYAEKIITERNNIQRIPERLTESRTLSIISARSSFVMQCYFDFKRQFPVKNVQDTFFEAGLRENLRAVVAQQCRIGIMVMFQRVFPKYAELADQYNLRLQVLKRDIPPVAFMSRRHALAQQKTVSLDDLARHPFVADAHLDYDDTLEILGLSRCGDLLYICDRGSVFDAVRKDGYLSMGINIAPDDAQALGCVCRPIETDETMAVCLLHARSFPLNPRENQFIKYLTQRLSEYYDTRV